MKQFLKKPKDYDLAKNILAIEDDVNDIFQAIIEDSDNNIFKAIIYRNEAYELLKRFRTDGDYICLVMKEPVWNIFVKMLDCSIARTLLEERLKAHFQCDFISLAYPQRPPYYLLKIWYTLSKEEGLELEAQFKKELETADLTTTSGFEAVENALETYWVERK